ncbi:MAG: cupin domain-containing protein [Myxococcaceae bacterium]|jgi:quercetin dioxygenase-like cupin family protein|nr:cupin domain-containing protein [Myxococcaceae bacterium]
MPHDEPASPVDLPSPERVRPTRAVRAGQVVEGPHTRIEFEVTSADSGGRLLSFRQTFQPGPFSPPVHVHASQTERFTVVSGRLGVRVGEAVQVLGPGQTVAVPPGTPHTLWNAGAGPCVHRVQLEPARRMEHFFVGIVTLEAEGAIPPRRLSQLARLARLFLDHENRVPGLPWSVFKVVLRLVAFVGGAR